MAIKAINIVLDPSDNPQSMIFVEIENEKGKSINIGRSFQRESDGMWIIQIKQEDFDGE